ncbi:hypothetical protein GCM10011415_34660 [Salipiger pallidus]|uniref:Uncharacterized protein n=1 Tax=Salipiger pallidus TaxID=1775170 RepID=A0A8J3EHW2_9RHOB|nr:hypothetical protein [Salipiger pallidus]GGG82072.1 hypothetical protein GCM10011415_34660 [Salipiger pallidus]
MVLANALVSGVPFTTSEPSVALTLDSRDRPFSFEDESFDLAIHYGQPRGPGAVSTYPCNEIVLPVAAPSVWIP